jgi:molybdenum cofactor guanylyltransferase
VGEEAQPLGVVLAGGSATRLGGSKAIVDLGGRPLISYPLAAFAETGIEVVVVAKAATALPLLDVPVLLEPDEPTHPLLGLVTALAHAGGRPIVSTPCDTPFITAALVTALAGSPATAAVHDGTRLHPLLAQYQPGDVPALQRGLEAGASATSTAESLSPARIESDPETTFNVNTTEDLAAATARLAD